jgi:hypothetical protein
MSHVIIFCRTPLGAGRGFGADILSLDLGVSPKSAQLRWRQALLELPDGHPFRFVCCAVAAIQFGQIVHPFPEFFALYVSGLLRSDIAIAIGVDFDDQELTHEIVRWQHQTAQEQAEERIRTTTNTYLRLAGALGFARQFMDVLKRERKLYEERISAPPRRLGAIA